LVDPTLAARYQMDRFHAGTTGKGHDCPSPDLGPLSTYAAASPPLECSEKNRSPAHAGSSALPVSRLPSLTPQQQAGCQSGLNHLMRQRQRRRREHEGW
jgi:hypothetical protein